MSDKTYEFYTKILLDTAHIAHQRDEVFDFLLSLAAVSCLMRAEFPEVVDEIEKVDLVVTNKGKRIS